MLDRMPTSSPNSIALHSTTLHYITLHYTTLPRIRLQYIIYIQHNLSPHNLLTLYSSTHDLIILNQHQSVTISFLFPAFPLPSLGLSSQCCSRHAGKNGLLCAVLLLGSLAHLVLKKNHCVCHRRVVEAIFGSLWFAAKAADSGSGFCMEERNTWPPSRWDQKRIRRTGVNL